MPDYRRYRVPGGTYFFTVNLLERRRIRWCGISMCCAMRSEPPNVNGLFISMSGWCYRIICTVCGRLPPGDDDFSNSWKAIKIRFVQKLPATERRSKVRAAKGERGVWQRRFWEHAIRDDRDCVHHVDYCHWNPMKHGLVR